MIANGAPARHRRKARLLVLLAVGALLVAGALWRPTRELVTCPQWYPECRGAEPAPMPDWVIPSDPQERAAYDYAHSLPFPPGMPQPVPFDFRQARMIDVMGGKSVAQQYFAHLCRTEDVEVIARRVENVDGFLLMRPRADTEGTPADSDRYGTEEPTGIGWFSDDGQLNEKHDTLRDAYLQPLYGVYRYVEYVKQTSPLIAVYVERLDKRDGKDVHSGCVANWRSRTSGVVSVPCMWTPRVEADKIRSRYAYTWRGLRRPRDREFGIAGGEFLVVDRQTNEVLAVKRTFNSTYVPRRPEFTKWSAARECRRLKDAPPLPRFIAKVLVPNLHVNDDFVPADELDNYHIRLRSIIENKYSN